jgi:hypothetical protein
MKGAALAAAAASVAGQPCLAASLGPDGGMARGKVGAFAGASLRLPFGAGRHSAAASARLQVSSVTLAYDRRSGGLAERFGTGVDLGLNRSGRPDLRLAGSAPAEVKRRIGFKGSTGYIVVGGVVLIVLLLAAVASAQPKPGPQPGDFGP